MPRSGSVLKGPMPVPSAKEVLEQFVKFVPGEEVSRMTSQLDIWDFTKEVKIICKSGNVYRATWTKDDGWSIFTLEPTEVKR